MEDEFMYSGRAPRSTADAWPSAEDVADTPLENQLFYAQIRVKDRGHHTRMAAHDFKMLKMDLARNTRALDAKKAEQERERARLDINQSLDAPDEDDDRNIRPADVAFQERQIAELERQIAKEASFQSSEKKERDKDQTFTLFVLAVMAVYLIWQPKPLSLN